jgi:hypothetical protein
MNARDNQFSNTTKDRRSKNKRFLKSTVLIINRGDNQIRTGDDGVADRSLTTWLCRHITLPCSTATHILYQYILYSSRIFLFFLKVFFVFFDILQKLHYNITIIDKAQNTVRAYCIHYHFTCMCSAHKCYKQA